jgi:EAL domain-containing protein (putative c-di-GMP-specific phosphodiesterase class I)
LKVDRSFVYNVTESEESLEIIRAVCGLAKIFKMSLVAEGVKTKEQYLLCKSLNCDYAQGFYFSPALDSQKAEELLVSQRSWT